MLPKLFRNLIVFAFAPLSMAQVQLQFAFPAFAPLNAPYSVSRIVSLPNGDTLFISSSSVSDAAGLYYYSPIQHSQIELAALGPAPAFVPPVLGGSGNDVPQAAAVDPSGNIWIAGNTDSDDFNLVNPIVPQKVPYRTAGFVLELDPTGTKLLFATYLAGQQRPNLTCPDCYNASFATAIAIDGSGNVYVGGETDEPDFPTTPGAFMTKGAGSDVVRDVFFYSFVVKISPAGKLVYSTLLGTGNSSCAPDPSGCIGKQSTSASVSGIAADSAGEATVAGVESGVTGPGYVSRVAADGSRLLWSASIGGSAGVGTLFMAQEPNGDVDLLDGGGTGLFAEKLSSDGSTVIYSTDLGQSADASAAGIVLDASGNVYLAGTSSSPQFPVLAGVPNLGADFVLELDPSGAKPQTLFRFPRGTVSGPPSFDTSGQLLLPGPSGSLLTLPPNYAFNTPAIVGFANSASYALDTGLAPGELVSLFGFDLGGQNVQVLVGGVAATVLYAGPNQINVQAPFEIWSIYGLPRIQIVTPSGTVTSGPVPSAQSVGIFTSDGVHAAALNQDGTVNSASNPAAPGSIVTFFGTGAIWRSGIKDGAVASSAVPLDQEQNRFEVVDRSDAPATILYAGAAPSLIYGVFQLNVQLPPDAVPPLTLQTYSAASATLLSSNAVQIYLQ